ncbi:membrane protein [Virgibacillus soli]|nr:membrane protein [Virgibacillus soli]
MTKFRSLKILDWFQPLFIWLKMDYKMMRKILEMKLILDQRRTPTIFQGEKQAKGNQFLKTLGVYALYGLLLVFFVFLDQYMFQMSIIFAITMFLMMTSLIADFSSVLLDVKDKTIFHTKPIDTRTINTAKMLHITYYMAFITGAFISVPTLVMIGRQGIAFFLLFLLEVVLLILFIIAITALVYLLILKFFGSDQLKNLINYVQIILSIAVVIGYQIFIRAFDFVDLEIAFAFEWWHVLLPPIWFAAPFELLLGHNYSWEYILLAIMVLVIPFISLAIYIWQMPSFERNLQKLMGETGEVRSRKFSLTRFWESLVCFSQEEKMFFRFSANMMSRERDFKLKVYPLLGIGLVFPFIFIMNDAMTGSLDELANSKMYLNIYFSTFMIGSVVYMLQCSKDYKGGWIFKIIPLRQTSKFYGAAIKAFLLKLYLPIYLLISLVYLFLFSWKIIPDLLVALMPAVFQSLLAYKLINNERFPFTKPFESIQQGGNTASFFLLMLIVGLFVLFHFLATLIPYGVWGYFVLLFIGMIISWKITFKEKKIVE